MTKEQQGYPTHKQELLALMTEAPPELVEGEEEFEVEDILAHRLVGPHKQPEFLVCFKGYGPEDDIWLPLLNLEHAQDIL